jgi:predicted glutamine amidotransferase
VSTLIAAVGRFQMDVLARATLDAAGTDGHAGGWGAAYCYGNRLETIRSALPCAQDPDFGKLNELRTDMALICIGGMTPASPRELKPYLRRETGHTWTFAHSGIVKHEDRLDTGGRITDSKNPSERYFLYLLGKLEEQAPVESLASAMAALGDEDSLSFCLMCAEMMLVGCWQEDGDKGIEGQRDKVTDTRSLDPLIPRSLAPESPGLWSGEGGLAKYFSTKPLHSLPEVQWEMMPNRTVLAITRDRRELP